MPSERPASQAPRWASRYSLRTRLIVGQLALLALVCLLISIVTVVSLNAFLIHQLDGQLSFASSRGQHFAQGDGPPGDDGGPPPSQAPGQSDGTVSAVIVGGTVVSSGRLTPGSGTEVTLTAGQDAVLAGVPVDGQPRSEQLGSLGDYRLMAVSNDTGAVIVTGLPMSGVDNTVLIAELVLGGLSLIVLAVAGIASTLIIRRTLRPLHRLVTTASRVTELRLDRGEGALPVRVPDRDTDPRTEVGQVGAALNRMLGHVDNALTARHASETRVRQFVADASHELRTPLAAIRGYAELAGRYRDVPPEVEHAIGRVESESRRMTALVEDLLLLARLDSGRPLELQPVDLSRLVLDAVGDARVAGPDHRWRLDLPAEPVHALGDQAGLHQVLANLLANGRTHTPPGSTITTGLSTRDDRVVLTVTDDGPGIPAELRPEVFERFARGDSSRSRAAGSTGLGLSIVAAVVHAQHGVVRLDSRPGLTLFTVELPAR